MWPHGDCSFASRGFCAARSSTGGPTWLDDLAAASHSERIRRHGSRDAGTSADISSIADLNRSNERRIATHECAGSDGRLVLSRAIIVTCDHACANVRAVANGSVSQIAEMAGLGSFTEASFFHLNKVTHMGLLRDVAARAQVREWANRCVAVNDGTGYPCGLVADQIPLGARIFAVADTLDAITSDRPYRRASNFDVARQEILRCSGTQFDPTVVEVFIKVPSSLWIDLRREIESKPRLFSEIDAEVSKYVVTRS